MARDIRRTRLSRTRGFLAVALAFAVTGCVTNHYQVRIENDGLNFDLPTKGNYTSGIELSFSSGSPVEACTEANDCVPTLLQKMVQTLNVFRHTNSPEFEFSKEDSLSTWVEWGIGQQFFTPTELTASSIVHEDRPYAGWLYGHLTIRNDRFDDGDLLGRQNDRHRTVSLQLGVVGPSSLASATQKFWHKNICSCTYPEGWRHQIRDEPGFIVTFAQEDRQWQRRHNEFWSSDLSSIAQLHLGNVRTAFSVGGRYRLGYELPRHFSIFASSANRIEAPVFFNVFVDFTGHATLRDIFLDGNSFKTSPHTVDKRYLFREARAGFELRRHNLRLNVSYSQRGKQYDTQRKSDRFGAVTFSYAR